MYPDESNYSASAGLVGASQLGQNARDRSDMEIMAERARQLNEVASQSLATIAEFLSRMGRNGPPTTGRPDSGPAKPVAVGHLPDLSSSLDDLGERLQRMADFASRLNQIG